MLKRQGYRRNAKSRSLNLETFYHYTNLHSILHCLKRNIYTMRIERKNNEENGRQIILQPLCLKILLNTYICSLRENGLNRTAACLQLTTILKSLWIVFLDGLMRFLIGAWDKSYNENKRKTTEKI